MFADSGMPTPPGRGQCFRREKFSGSEVTSRGTALGVQAGGSGCPCPPVLLMAIPLPSSLAGGIEVSPDRAGGLPDDGQDCLPVVLVEVFPSLYHHPQTGVL